MIMRRMEAKQYPPSERHVCPRSRLPSFPSAPFPVMPDLIGHPSHPEISHYSRLQNRFPAADPFECQSRLQDVCTCHEHGPVCCACSVIWHICRIYLSMIKKTLSYDIIFEANHYICMRYQLNVKSMQDLNRLKVVLVEQKKTGKWLAEQLGKDPSTVSKWCSNKIQPSLEMLSQIAKTLNVDTKELIN